MEDTVMISLLKVIILRINTYSLSPMAIKWC